MTGRFELEREAARALRPPRRAADVAPEAGPFPQGVAALDETRLIIGDTFRPNRLALGLGTATLAVAPLIFWIWGWMDGRRAQEADMLSLLDDEIAAFGTVYIENQIAGGDRTLPLIWPDRSLSLLEYLRYDWVLSPGGWQANLPLALFVLAALLAGMTGLWFVARMAPKGPLVFDRRIQAVFALRRGALLAAPWGKVRFVQRAWEFGWLLSDEAGAEHLVEVRLPRDGQGALAEAAGGLHVARIAAFMAEGPGSLAGTRVAAGGIDLPADLSARAEARLSQREGRG